MLARLVVHLKSNTRHLVKGFQRGRKEARGFSFAMKAALGIATGGALAAFAAFKSLGGALTRLDRTAKIANQTGFGTAAIAGLGLAAEEGGSSVEGLDKGLQTFTRRLGEAATKGGAAADVLTRLGTPIQDLQGLKPEQQLATVAEALKNITDPAKQSAAAYELFGRQGQELLPMLKQGADGINKFIAEADKLGLGFSEEELARVEAANDAVNRVKRSIGALWQRVAIAAAPAIEFISSKLVAFVGWARAAFASVAQTFAPVVAFISTQFSALGTTIASTFAGIKQWATDAWGWVMSKITPLIPVAMGLGRAYMAAFQAVWGIGVAAFGAITSAAKTLWGWIQSGLQSVLGWFGTSFTGIVETAVTAYAMLEYGFQNWQKVGQVAILGVMLSAVSFFNEIVYFFSTKLPALLSWFRTNWKDIFFSAFDYVSTIFINLGENIRSGIKGLWDYIWSGGSKKMKDSWIPLEQGFKNTIKKMPDIPPRVIGPVEAKLKGEFDALNAEVAGGMQAHVQKRLGELDEFRNRTNVTLNDPNAPGADGQGNGDGDPNSGEGDDTENAGIKVVDAREKGSEATLKSIFASQNRNNTASQQLAEQKKQTKSLDTIAAEIPRNRPEVAGAFS